MKGQNRPAFGLTGLLLALLPCLVFAQRSGSQNAVSASDSALVALYNETCEKSGWRIGEFDTANFYAGKALKLSVKLKYQRGAAKAYHNKGAIFHSLGEPEGAISNYLNALILYRALADSNAMSSIHGNLGSAYAMQGKYSEALDNHFRAQQIAEKMGNKKAMASNYINIGVVYSDQGEGEKALDYYRKALDLTVLTGDKRRQSGVLANIGVEYMMAGNDSAALTYFEKAYAMDKELNNKAGMAGNLGNIGSIYFNRKDFDKALENYSGALSIREETGDLAGQALSFDNLGSLYQEKGDPILARKYLNKAIAIARELQMVHQLKDFYQNLFKLHAATGKSKEALDAYQMHIAFRDCVLSETNQKAAIQKEMQFNFEKKAAADSVANAKQMEVKNAEIKVRQNQQYALFGGLALVMVFAGFIFNRFRVTQRQKAIIENQKIEVESAKHIIEEKHKEITDSINYAERIQRSFLSTTEMLDENLGEYFILFRPKDVVSGDFYWSAKLENGNFLLATADSTGHGVPGSIMSLLNITSLEKAIETTDDPGEILNKTRRTIIERLKKDGSPEGGKDGMDATLMSFNPGRSRVSVAAANNPVWIIRGTEIVEVKPDKMPVGRSDKEDLSFTSNEFDLQKGDVIYTLTDGFPDQFGGVKGKKFKSKNLKELLQANAHLPMQEQKQLLENTLKSWMGVLEQVDDITVIGIRI